MECTGARWWNEYLPRLVTEVIEKTGIAGIYVDYFQWSAPCYALHHDHAPGGGSFYVQGKVNLIKSIRKQIAALPDGPGYLAVSSEAVGGIPFSEECHVMFDDPLRGLADSKGVVSIPLFRMVCDNIKMSMITGVPGDFARGTGFACWEVTNRVLTYGQVLGFGSSLAEFFPALSSRDFAEYYEYMGRVASFLRDQYFFKYHNGTLMRMPEVTVNDADDLTKIVCMSEKATEPQPRALPYYTGAVNAGMFRAPNGDYAVAVANPWIGDPKRTLEVTVAIDRTRYRDFPDKARCVFHPNERQSVLVAVPSGNTIVLTARLEPGQIAYWEWVK
jgi:hypothetical protein